MPVHHWGRVRLEAEAKDVSPSTSPKKCHRLLTISPVLSPFSLSSPFSFFLCFVCIIFSLCNGLDLSLTCPLTSFKECSQKNCTSFPTFGSRQHRIKSHLWFKISFNLYLNILEFLLQPQQESNAKIIPKERFFKTSQEPLLYYMNLPRKF